MKEKNIQLKQLSTKRRIRMTCIIGGKCVDGVVLISDSKITYDDHPPDYMAKLDRDYHPIITGGAGQTDLYDIFKTNVVPVMQSGSVIPEDFPNQQIQNMRSNIQTSGIVHIYAPGSAGGYNYGAIQNRFSTLIRKINKSTQASDRNGQLELLTATQLADIHEAKLTVTTTVGNSDVYKYRAIGDGEQYSYVFLKPFYDNASTIDMYSVIRLSYFIIRFLDTFELSTGIGGPPQFWGIPNQGNLFTHNDKLEWVKQFENETALMLKNFRRNGIDALLTPET